MALLPAMRDIYSKNNKLIQFKTIRIRAAYLHWCLVSVCIPITLNQ